MLAVPDGFQPQIANPETHGLELHERHPVVFGGDPTEPGNRVMLPPPTHAEACAFFNKVAKSARPQPANMVGGHSTVSRLLRLISGPKASLLVCGRRCVSGRRLRGAAERVIVGPVEDDDGQER